MELSSLLKEIKKNFAEEIREKPVWGKAEILDTFDRIFLKTIEDFVQEKENT